MQATQRNNVNVIGDGPVTLMFAHGFGCDQTMWHAVTRAFPDCRIVLFDQLGTGRSIWTEGELQAYSSLERYADDVLSIVDELDIQRAVFIGHSVGAMIGVLAAVKRPAVFSKLVLIAPNPCYIDEPGYVGGFRRATLEKMLDFLDEDYLAWAHTMAPTIMGNLHRLELANELTAAFCRFEPHIARRFARLVFQSDHRAALARVRVPTLVLQSMEDPFAPEVVGLYVHARIPGSAYRLLDATGHCPHLSAHEATAAAIRAFLEDGPAGR